MELPRGLVLIVTYSRMLKGNKLVRRDVSVTKVANPHVILTWTGRGFFKERVRFRNQKRVFNASGSEPKTALM